MKKKMLNFGEHTITPKKTQLLLVTRLYLIDES